MDVKPATTPRPLPLALPPAPARVPRPSPPAPFTAAEPALEAMDAPLPAPELEAAEEDLSADPPERDRIVVLGRRQSGKTIFLACNYARLWKSMDGMTAKALSGQVHKQLMTVHQMLQEGQWPPSTLGTSQIDLELEWEGRKRLLVALDFAGELFSKAFVDEQSDWPGVRELVRHIDHAAAVILLVDPSVVAGMDARAAMDDDFGLVQAVQRIRNWPGGDGVPIVLVLTKSDQHQELLDRFGGPLEFVRRHFPAMVRLLHRIPIVQVSAVQAERMADGMARPRADSTPVNLDTPLRFCLREIARAEQRLEIDQAESQRRMMQARAAREQQQSQRRRETALAAGIGAIVVIGLAVTALILYLGV